MENTHSLQTGIDSSPIYGLMVHNEKPSKDVPFYVPLIAGGVSGTVTRVLCQPLDVIKIRFQLQIEPISKRSVTSKYKSIPQAFRLIFREEGLLALWKGLVPGEFLSMTYGVVQFGVYETLVKEAKTHPKFATNKAKTEFVCGFLAGSLATVASSPFDIVRTRLVVQGKNKVYRNTFHGLNLIVRQEGVRGLFKGLTPTLIQIGPLTGIQFASFNFYKRLFSKINYEEVKSRWFSVSETVAAGSLAGFTAKILTYPLDLFRKRMQFQGFQQARRGYGKNFTCTSLITCFTETVKVENATGLFKGLSPSLLKATIVNALIFTIYEETYRFLL